MDQGRESRILYDSVVNQSSGMECSESEKKRNGGQSKTTAHVGDTRNKQEFRSEPHIEKEVLREKKASFALGRKDAIRDPEKNARPSTWKGK